MSNGEKTDGKCNYHPTQDGGYCGQTAGMGTDHLGEGYCKYHGGCSTGGAREGSGAPEGNTNSVSHGLYAETNKFYQNVCTDKQRVLVDEIFQDYCTQFREKNGDPHTGEQSRLFEIAVNHVKIIYSDNWASEKPESLESGNPMVDKGERFNTEGVRYQEYKETVVLQGQTKLRNSDRQWLKDYGLLEDPQSQQADSIQDLASLWAED